MMGDGIKLSPFVYWSQTKEDISLRIELRNTQTPKVSIESNKLSFAAVGVGARGEATYEFFLEFYQLINIAKSSFRVLDHQVDISLKKDKFENWPRLLQNSQKPAWLKIDFEKFQYPAEDFDDEVRDVRDDYPELYQKLLEDELGPSSHFDSLQYNLKKIYLALYNIYQFVGFLMVVSVIAFRYYRDGVASMEGTYDSVSWVLKLCLLTQFLEVFHPLLGYTKGSTLESLIQVGGRGIIFYCLIHCEERMRTKPVVFYLFLTWSLVELFRYPYYFLRGINLDIGLVTWLRYTVWIPLYPLGFILEGIVILRSIPYFEETKMFTVSLPNRFNLAFCFPTFLRCYLLLFFLPVMFKMTSHMKGQRSRKLGGGGTKKKTNSKEA